MNGKYLNATLTTYENNCMSLSCQGTMKIVDSKIVEVGFKGFPRASGDGWVSFYRDSKIGDIITSDKINTILSYNGKYNIVSVLSK